jgi:hypothetical protein
MLEAWELALCQTTQSQDRGSRSLRAPGTLLANPLDAHPMCESPCGW